MSEPLLLGKADGRRVRVLFLDDMAWRHTEFALALGRRGDLVELRRAWTAEEAIELLDIYEFDQVFLDHDLCEDDIMLEVGEKGRERTGMDVVDHILAMDSPPQDIVIHSMNGPARMEMWRRLQESGRVARARPIDFYSLREALLR